MPYLGETLPCARELTNGHDPFVVKVYVPCLVDFVADLDVEALVLSSSSATHLLAASQARYRRMAFAMREAQ